MIPPKHPRQPKGALDDAITFGGKTDQETPNAFQIKPPPLPKKMIIRANTEPISKDLQKSMETSLCVMANPTYDIDPNWDASSAGSSISYELKGLDVESCDSLERPVHKERPVPSAANSVSSLTTLSIKDRFSSSMESLYSRCGPAWRQGRGIQKPQRHALYRGLENREEVVGKIRSLHTDALKKLAVKCEDLFMAGQKDKLRFGVDSWSDFRLTSDKPCCEAGDAVYYTASYAKDPLNNYAVKVRTYYKSYFNLTEHTVVRIGLFFSFILPLSKKLLSICLVPDAVMSQGPCLLSRGEDRHVKRMAYTTCYRMLR